MKHLFIDTNIYLRFYHFSSDTLEELNKLLTNVKSKNIKLYITSQVVHEFWRNREAKISLSLKTLSSQKLPDKYPQMCKSYDEYPKLRDLSKSYSKLLTQLMENLKKDIDGNQCGADKIIDGLFNAAQKLDTDDDIIQNAKTRVALGNPPGRDNSLGDSINWELLLKNVPNKTDLHLVTVDKKDYSSQIDGTRLAEFLNREWKEKKNSTIHYYTQLSDFLSREFPDIKLPSDLELEADLQKETAINNLVNSVNFQMTHQAIKDLRGFNDFTDDQIREIVEASTVNTQIYWIHEDYDLKAFLLELINGKEDVLPTELLEDFDRIYREELVTSSNDDELPF
jgi:hypothetical protein